MILKHFCCRRSAKSLLLQQNMQSYGIVLHSLRYGDTRMIVDIFTESAGVVSFILPATRNRKGGMRAIAWQPLSLVEVIWEARPRTALQKPKSLVLWHPWRSLHIDPRKTAIGLYLSEVLHHALRREQENRPLFLFIVNALTWFDESERNYVNFHIVFLLHLTRFLGFLPNVEDWHEGDFFDLQAAIFTRTRPYHIYYLEPEEAALVPKFLRMDLRSMRAVGLNRAIRRRTLEIISDFYRLHIPEFPETRSLDVLTEVFE
jgi:DNA repair protein RecO (recombination protein O)